MNKTYFSQAKLMLVSFSLLALCGSLILLPAVYCRAYENESVVDEVVSFSSIAGIWRSANGERVLCFDSDGGFTRESHIDLKYLPSALEEFASQPVSGTYTIVGRNRISLRFTMGYIIAAGAAGYRVALPQEALGSSKELAGAAGLVALPQIEMLVTGPNRMIEDFSFMFGLWHTSGTVFYRD